MTEQKAWTPDQPLRADATDEQIEARSSYIALGNIASTEFLALEDHSAVRVAREFASACYRRATSVGAVGKPIDDRYQRLFEDVLRCIPADWKPDYGREWGAHLGNILAEFVDDVRAGRYPGHSHRETDAWREAFDALAASCYEHFAHLPGDYDAIKAKALAANPRAVRWENSPEVQAAREAHEQAVNAQYVAGNDATEDQLNAPDETLDVLLTAVTACYTNPKPEKTDD